ncbi:transglycosylase domain-containing protein, partial [Patescibacteria group bacterium]|nr:transglycosylase domain-containing protein [Patescibacteria group bacterium]
MKNKKKKNIKLRIKRWWKIGAGVVLLMLLFLLWLVKDIPNPKKLVSGNYPESSRIYDRNGKLLYEFFSEKRRVTVGLEEIPENLKKATLAIEDAKFYRHFGFDLQGIVRAVYRTVFKKKLEGGSTLTQQLVKNALLTPERTLSRKIKEAVLTIATEILYSKDKILEMYLNQTPYGGTYWGVEVAARGYFNKEVKDLSLAESALLAGLPGSPTKYSPFSYPE